MIQNVDERLDIMAKFTKDESKLYLVRKHEGVGNYDKQLIKYTKKTNHKPQNPKTPKPQNPK